MISNVFLISVTVSWFAFLAAPYLLISWLTPFDVDGLLTIPVWILGAVCAFVGAGLYYVVGRQILKWVGLWGEHD